VSEASDVVAPTLALLQGTFAHVVEAWRCNSGKVKVRGGWMQLAPKGTADVLGYFRAGGRMFGVEGKCSHRDGCPCESCADQRAWGERLVKAGGVYVRARSLDDVVKGLGLAGRATGKNEGVRDVPLSITPIAAPNADSTESSDYLSKYMLNLLRLPIAKRRRIERAVESGEMSDSEIAIEFGVDRRVASAAFLLVNGSSRRGIKRD
jgi:hypothetical protein